MVKDNVQHQISQTKFWSILFGYSGLYLQKCGGVPLNLDWKGDTEFLVPTSQIDC